MSYDEAYGHGALEQGEDIVSINSFSKYFSMTGWRLGWMVLPEDLVAPVEKLAQNLYICASTVAQHAALASFDAASIEACEQRREQFRRRRDVVVPALQAMGLQVPVMPDGAFYAWADCSAHSGSSWDFCFDMMKRAHVALTPGRDFGPHGGRALVRCSFASLMDALEQALSGRRASCADAGRDLPAGRAPRRAGPPEARIRAQARIHVLSSCAKFRHKRLTAGQKPRFRAAAGGTPAQLPRLGHPPVQDIAGRDAEASEFAVTVVSIPMSRLVRVRCRTTEELPRRRSTRRHGAARAGEHGATR